MKITPTLRLVCLKTAYLIHLVQFSNFVHRALPSSNSVGFVQQCLSLATDSHKSIENVIFIDTQN